MIWMAALLACKEPDPDATGPRWDTASDPRPTTTDPTPDTLSVVDTGSTTVTDTGGDPGLCLGDGPAEVSVGWGGASAFVPYDDGDDLPLLEGVSGEWGFAFDVSTLGLDTTRDMNAILRVGFRGNGQVEDRQEEWLAKLRLQCPRPGPGWVRVFAPLPDAMQAGAPAGELDGVEAEIAFSVVDVGREQDTRFVDLYFTR